MNYKITKSVFFLALGKSGQKLLEKFLEYQLQEKIKERNERELVSGCSRHWLLDIS